jgi:hypothetical protein
MQMHMPQHMNELKPQPSSRRRARLPGAFATDCLLTFAESRELGEVMPVYHRLFHLAAQHCHAEGRFKDMREICLAGLRVYGWTWAPHAARSGIYYALGQCYVDEHNFHSALGVSSVSSPDTSLSRARFHTLCCDGRPTRAPSATTGPRSPITTRRWSRTRCSWG